MTETRGLSLVIPPPAWVRVEIERRWAIAREAYQGTREMCRLFGTTEEEYVLRYAALNFPPITWSSTDVSSDAEVTL